MRREYAKTVVARCARIAPAFGFGGIGNSYIRMHGQDAIVHYEEDHADD